MMKSTEMGVFTRAFLTDRARAATFAKVAFLALLSLTLVWWLDPALDTDASAGLLWRNALPFSLVALFLYGLSGRFLLSAWLSAGLGWALFAINDLKEREMNAPLMPGDWALRDQVLRHMDFFSRYAAGGLMIVLALLAFIAVCGVLYWLERRWKHPARVTRVLLISLPLVLLYTAFQGYGSWKRVYSDTALAGFQSWSPVASTRQVGVMAALVRLTQDQRITIPEPDRRVVTDFATKYSANLREMAKRDVPSELPDIVLVQSEAFFQPEILNGIGPGEFTPNFTRLSATGIAGSLLTPTYGGGTIRTEFEVLTGYPMFAFPAMPYPYFGLVGPWMPSVPRRLQAFGYSTALFHPFRGDFWNRQQVMPTLGFQHSYYENEFAGAAHAGAYVADRALFDFVFEYLQKKEKAPSFSMVITMENHGPWDNDATDLPNALDGLPLPSGLSERGARQMRYYLSHLVNGDAALGDFAQRLMARSRWTILLFYGDHLPSLDEAFQNLGFDDGKSYAEQSTRYMLLSNRPLAPRKRDLSAYELPGLLFDTIGLRTDGYLAFDGAIRRAQARDQPSRAPHYGQVYLNAAQMEVRCGHKLSLAGTCDQQPDTSAPAFSASK
jgi:phosphoglycerol transferase MdoB-like AlkP superfamily enzyme